VAAAELRRVEFMRVHIASSPVSFTLVVVILAGLLGCAPPQLGQHPYSSRLTAGNQSGEVRYLLYLPDTYGRDRRVKWPLILYLHGYGERGEDLDLLRIHPLPRTLESQKDFPFIVVSPQLPATFHGWDGRLELLDALLLRVQARYSVDPRRVYVTGISMGGSGTWKMALRRPRRFAAIAPIAGFYAYRSREVPPNICDLRDLPIWAFHGAQDHEVELYQDEILVDALKACGGRVKFTVYDDADHPGTWRRAYADPALFEWLAAQASP
jgi:predicted peptidase